MMDRETVSDPLWTYYRDMSANALLDRAREEALGRELQACRKRIERALRALPGSYGRIVRGGPVCDLEKTRDRLLRWQDYDGVDAAIKTLIREVVELSDRALGAREELIVANLRLVVHIAKKYVAHGIPLADLIQEGNLGLVRAVDRFDPDRGNRLSTYAYHCIKRAIERSIEVHRRSALQPVWFARSDGHSVSATA